MARSQPRRLEPLPRALLLLLAALALTAIVASALAIAAVPTAGPSGSPSGAGSGATSPGVGTPGAEPSGPSPSASSTQRPTPSPARIALPPEGRSIASGPSPFSPCEVGAPASPDPNAAPSTVYPEAEVEPWAVVDPTDPLTILVAWQQDRWSDGAARGIVTGVSHDGGVTWRPTWPAFSACAGGPSAEDGGYTRASDPWLAVTAEGTILETTLATSSDKRISAVLASRSTDGGDSWSPPAAIVRDTTADHFNDKESITADPNDPGTAYVVWDRTGGQGEAGETGSPAPTGSEPPPFVADVLLATTADGGLTWRAPQVIFRGAPNRAMIGGQLAVLPDGTLVVVAELLEDYGRRSARTFEAALRSTDGGATWSDPAVIAEARGFDVVDPASRRPIRSGWALPDIAVDRSTGRLYATWTDGRFAGDRAGIALSSSDDGGATWSMPRAVDAVEPERASFTPAIEVAPDGTVVATYYRATIDEAARDDFATSVVIARSSDSGATWQRQDLSPAPFDLHGAPDAGGLFLGDYTGLAIASSATGGTTDWRAIAAGSIVNAGDVANRTDVAVTVAGPQ